MKLKRIIKKARSYVKSVRKDANYARRAYALSRRIAEQVRKGAGKGLDRARIFITARVKETLSVPAPRKRVVSNAGEIYYRATTPASSGAPPRKLSGRLRSSFISVMINETTAAFGSNAKGMPSGKHPQGFPYPKYHEVAQPGVPGSGKHRYVEPTFRKWRKQITKIIGEGVIRAFTG